MSKLYPSITEELQQFIAEQPMFFVATAPLDAAGHINVSPKGHDSLRVLSPHSVAYLDLTGSGNETSAHLQDNGRITFLFCSFQETANILRLYGKGRTILPDTDEWGELYPLFTPLPGGRQIILAEIDRVQTSCGFGIPLFEYVEQRETLTGWAKKKGPEGLLEYQRKKNVTSIDGILTPLGDRFQQETEIPES